MSELPTTFESELANSDCAALKKRKNDKQDKAYPSKRRPKLRTATGGKAAEFGVAPTTCSVILKGTIVPESIRYDASSGQGNVGADSVVPQHRPVYIDKK